MASASSGMPADQKPDPDPRKARPGVCGLCDRSWPGSLAVAVRRGDTGIPSPRPPTRGKEADWQHRHHDERNGRPEGAISRTQRLPPVGDPREDRAFRSFRTHANGRQMVGPRLSGRAALRQPLRGSIEGALRLGRPLGTQRRVSYRLRDRPLQGDIQKLDCVLAGAPRRPLCS